MLNLAERVKKINPSPTLGITALAKKMQKEGIKVISFGAGEPDFDTPESIKAKAILAIQEGFTKYTPSSGILELKEAICDKLERENKVKYNPEQIIVSCGAKHSLFNAILTLCEAGDEVIIPSPYWVSYAEMVKITGAKPVFLPGRMENEFQIEINELKKMVNKNTKLLILNSPNNPTGCVYEKELLQEIAKIVIDRQIFVISDEIYEKITYDDKKAVSIVNIDEKIKDLIIIVNGVSKSYSMTGWRIGFCAANKEIIKAMSSLQDHSTSNPTSIAQKAALEALLGPQDKVKEMVSEFDKRRLLMVEGLNKIKGVRCLKPSGAFYVFPCIKEILGKSYKDYFLEDSLKLGEYLLKVAKVAVVPGAAFGADEYLRLSYATSQEAIEEGIKRIKEVIENLS